MLWVTIKYQTLTTKTCKRIEIITFMVMILSMETMRLSYSDTVYGIINVPFNMEVE